MNRSYQRYLKFLVAYICNKAFGDMDMTEQELADRAGLHVKTVYKIRTRRTLDPKHQTIWKLLKAAKIDVRLVAEELAEVAAME